ncbi:hypothetical protein DM02DRAFT_58571 [Periconia macrospinosa]|uniref:Uncharacterized protein n=1 Tax=Periconia macrospinosa TaxID=97972 RepID=A0A2V1CWZ3_9PLEO|nr:hypothetical protein DM02DRAFT_58571 [Periconia macrospinosa]
MLGKTLPYLELHTALFSSILSTYHCFAYVCVCSIMAMHPEGMGRSYALADTSHYSTFSPVQMPTVRLARPLRNSMLNVGKQYKRK